MPCPKGIGHFFFYLSSKSLLIWAGCARISLSLSLTVIGVDIHQTIKIDDDMEIRAYYAGHVRDVILSCPREDVNISVCSCRTRPC
jgi:hypothetical protein